ncbi:unnamed protein product [Caenorhabditis brenneri]
MRLYLMFFFMFLFIIVNCFIDRKGLFGSAVSFFVGAPLDGNLVLKCLQSYNQNSQNGCDREAVNELCTCLSASSRWYTKNVVEPVFCVSAKTRWMVFTKLGQC